MTARLDQSMSLITELMEHPLEPSYDVAAAQRRELGLSPATRTGTPTVFLVAVVVGVLFALAAVNLRAASSVVGQTRLRLIEQITNGQTTGDELKSKVTALEGQIAAAQQAALGPSGLLERLAVLQVDTGARAVSGPGVVVTLDDAAAASGSNADPRASEGFGSGRVSAADLQIIVNGLWAAGAEAIAINGQRLTTRAAIRFAGQAILVDFRPLTRPYRITAVGEPGGLSSAFSGSPAGSYLKALGDNYGIPNAVKAEALVTCPAGTTTTMLYAQPGSPVAATPPSATPTPATKPTSTTKSMQTTPTNTTRVTTSPTTRKATSTVTETPR
ncbi:MAG: DUF881 domain-containing protein [Dermatophilaceae bacterium]|nr:DUF881 domain-containing protein [Dermatophilaceae bacterium]MBP9916977.1 DUF881 domain-containing protein [Dermatophilaceae bacterium]